MNRLILRFAYPLTAVILAIFAWVVVQRIVRGDDLTVLAVTAAVVWIAGVPVFIWLWPRITVGGFKRAILRRGFGGGPIPVNTLYAVPESSSSAAAAGSVLATGADDVLYVGGWLDLTDGPQVLHVPDSAGRYYSVQLTDPADGADFAYVGKRTTGTAAGDFLITGRRWAGTVPEGMTRVASPTDSVLVIGRVFVADESDQQAAYDVARCIRLTPLDASPR
ncbi:DUF1254 domain-containing protein [Microbacterium sp. X-17]|uniref:DUF1254 domain-containing protein n=1 Tax=Microbacterium sp. X-17 TaxID=3144404 RepID=UPI0031F4CA62